MIENKFIIIVTQYNAIDYIKKCLDSIHCQTYKNYEVVVMDDGSTDGTWDVIQNYPFHKIRNEVRNNYAFVNILRAINYLPLKGEEILVFVSGDDYLAGDFVFSYLNEVYQDDIWMTYGQYIPLSGDYGPYCQPIPDTRTYRNSRKWLATHLMTCKKKLWDLIDDNDFKNQNGEYARYACDTAFMFPMIEMCGSKRLRFIDKVLYVYNDVSPVCTYKILPKENLAEAEWYWDKPPYSELP